MNVLAVGDVVGDAGTDKVIGHLARVRREYEIDFCVINAENACTGNGLSRKKAEALLVAGADALTLGNHAFRQKDATVLLAHNENIIRPLNYPRGTVGRGAYQTEVKGKRVTIMNALGRIYMDYTDCPFQALDDAVKRCGGGIMLVDFHAEATSEKTAMGSFLDGRVSAVYGTHTHVQTADARILPKGTGYISDLGMTGPLHSCLGVRAEIVVERFTTCIPRRFEFADGAAQFNGAVFQISEETGRTQKVTALNFV
jgi:metallophosphoesterase (TIGR00282 family)